MVIDLCITIIQTIGAILEVVSIISTAGFVSTLNNFSPGIFYQNHKKNRTELVISQIKYTKSTLKNSSHNWYTNKTLSGRMKQVVVHTTPKSLQPVSKI